MELAKLCSSEYQLMIRRSLNRLFFMRSKSSSEAKQAGCSGLSLASKESGGDKTFDGESLLPVDLGLEAHQ